MVKNKKMNILFEILLLIWNIFSAIISSLSRWIWKPSEKSVHGEIVLVTGAGHGMGQLLALKLAMRGAKVAIVDINEKGVSDTSQLIQEAGFLSWDYVCDITDVEEVKRLGKKVSNDLGDVTMLFNNAGVLYCDDVLSLTDKMIANTFEVNIISHFWMIRQFLPAMKKKNYGHIIAMSSYSGISGNGTPFMTSYTASKHAVTGFMQGLTRELRRQNKTAIKTTCVFPSFVKTGMISNPTVKIASMCPYLKPEYVVKHIINGVLTDQINVEIPYNALNVLVRSVVPACILEVVFDFLKPQFDTISSNN